jgi:glycosyltransferase involved in cell wall biosynthesis
VVVRLSSLGVAAIRETIDRHALPPSQTQGAVGGVVLLIRSLHAGGAERQLVTLATALHRLGRRVHVATFYPGGELTERLVSAGVPVTSLGKKGRWDLAAFSLRLVRFIRRERPQVLYTWLPDPNVITALLRPFFPTVRLVWGIGASYMDLSQYSWVARVSYRAARALANRADLIIVNSSAGAAYHRRRGYPAERLRVVRNGIDTEYFRPDPIGRERLRAEWNVPSKAPLVGLVARLDPMKDHRTFLEAAARLAQRLPDVRFVCVGGGPPAYERELRQLSSALGLASRLCWAGTRADMPAVYSALDVSTLTSTGEGAPNVVAEAMACGTPCVVTDVGDSAEIVGGLGEVVPVRTPDAVASAWERVLADSLRRRSSVQRARVVTEFSVDQFVSRTEQCLWGST